MYFGSDSSHAFGTSTSASVYTSRSKVHGSSSSGRKVTDAVIWRMIAWISDVISFCGFSTAWSGPMDLPVCTSKTHRSSVSPESCPAITTTSFCTLPAASHSASCFSTPPRYEVRPLSALTIIVSPYFCLCSNSDAGYTPR